MGEQQKAPLLSEAAKTGVGQLAVSRLDSLHPVTVEALGIGHRAESHGLELGSYAPTILTVETGTPCILGMELMWLGTH